VNELSGPVPVERDATLDRETAADSQLLGAELATISARLRRLHSELEAHGPKGHPLALGDAGEQPRRPRRFS
jgi:hypothetical protein